MISCSANGSQYLESMYLAVSAWGEQNPFLPLLVGFTVFYGRSVSGLRIFTFTFIFMMHFQVIDFHLLEMHRSACHRIGRWILSGACLLGRIPSTQVDIAPAVLAVLVSFVTGGAVLMIIQDDFSETSDNSYAAFLVAVLLYGSLLL